MKHINVFHILAAALIAFSAPAFATDPAPPHRASSGTSAFSGSSARVAGHGNSGAWAETGNVSLGQVQVGHNAQFSRTTSESYSIGASTGRHGSFSGDGYGGSYAYTHGRFDRFDR